MKLKIYEYKNCNTCRNALKFLDRSKIEYEKVAIREKPPTKSELKKMLSFVKDTKRLFNTSGKDYKALNLKEKLPALNVEEQIDLLSRNGNLVKRPFLLSENFGLTGFNESEWKKSLA
ncbi:MAG: Spx/MgsR family RNA polymerase-binding regulatory protein [Leptospira sp.]|nr:Spx/MgsR family RNA polymerase-binding regulatory protein [Leptospira sp.]